MDARELLEQAYERWIGLTMLRPGAISCPSSSCHDCLSEATACIMPEGDAGGLGTQVPTRRAARRSG